jgi:hypothetical protein
MRPCAHCGEDQQLEPLGEGLVLCLRKGCGKITRPSLSAAQQARADARVPFDLQGFCGQAPED